MKSVPLSTFVLGGALVSIATVYSTDLAARDKSSQGASVSAGGVSVSAGPGGASVSAGGTSVSADRGGASVSTSGASVSADRGGASVSGGGGSVSADRGGASVSGGGTSVSADRGGASVSGRSASEDSDRQNTVTERPVGDRSYGSLGEWFDDLGSSLFGGRSKGSDGRKTTTTSSSVIDTTQTSESDGTQVNRARVVQKGSSGTSNVTRIEQTN
jgi:hypothetical protein